VEVLSNGENTSDSVFISLQSYLFVVLNITRVR